jgi:hypothetical protein
MKERKQMDPLSNGVSLTTPINNGQTNGHSPSIPRWRRTLQSNKIPVADVPPKQDQDTTDKNPQMPDLGAAQENNEREKAPADMSHAELVALLRQRKAELDSFEWNVFLEQLGNECGSRAQAAIEEFLNPDPRLSPEAEFEQVMQDNQHLVITDEMPKPMRPEALHGILGHVVSCMAEQTEAPEESLLIHLLTYMGNWLGRSAVTYVGGKKHFNTLYSLIVGPTYKGRKGTAKSMVDDFAEALDPEWYNNCVVGKSGYSTGEGLLWAIRDDREFYGKGGEPVTEPGVEDKRLMIVEEEFAKTLKTASRPNNVLTAYYRDLWQSPPHYQTGTKTTPVEVTDAHVSIVGHITVSDLSKLAASEDIGNGFFNRFLVCASQRRKIVKRPRPIDWTGNDFKQLIGRFRHAYQKVSERGVVWIRDCKAFEDAWDDYYPTIGEGRAANVAELAERQGDHVNRIALIFAVLDGSETKELKHLEAAIAVWDYCEASLGYAFSGSVVGNPMADTVWYALKKAPNGLTRNQIREGCFRRSTPAVEIQQVLDYLRASKLAFPTKKETNGRRAELWQAKR